MGRRSDQVMESIGDGMRKEEYTQSNETIHDLLSMCVFDQLSFQTYLNESEQRTR
jgi:hypothetical protein